MSNHTNTTWAQGATLRLVLKISGEMLSDGNGSPFGMGAVKIVAQIDELYKAAVLNGVKLQLSIVIGGGNIARGSMLKKMYGDQIDQTTAHYCGMVNTISNGLMLDGLLRGLGHEVNVMSALPISTVAEPYAYKVARSHLNKGRILIFVGGTGATGCTTDAAAIIRAAEVESHLVLKGTKVDYVYTLDPKKHPEEAVALPDLTYATFLSKGLNGIFDRPGIENAEANHVLIRIFDAQVPGNLLRAVKGEIGTLIHA